MGNACTVIIPPDLIAKARKRQVNISYVCREALRDVIEQIEKQETGPSRQELSPVYKPPVSINEGCNER